MTERMKMQPERKYFYIFAVLMALTIIVFFSFSFLKKNALASQEINIVFLVKSIDTNFTYWQVAIDGARTAKEEYGINLTISGPIYEIDISNQIRSIEYYAFHRPSLVILAACDYDKLVPAVKKLHSMGVPLITMDSGINSSIPASFIATDNVKAGEKAGYKISELLSTGDSVVILSHIKDTTSAIDREKGVRNAIGKIGKVRVTDVFNTDNFIDRAYFITLNLLKTRPDLRGIVALNETTTIGASRALKKLGVEKKVYLVGFDSNIEEIDDLQNGAIKALVVQKPFNMGYIAVKTSIDYLKGKKISSLIDTGSSLITLENMFDEENQKLLFPFSINKQ